MYLPNKYTAWYYSIINNAATRSTINGYTERHHIIPRSLGGSNSKKNLVTLTAREHFLCHWLLIKMTTDVNQLKMKHAFWRMLVSGVDFQLRYKPNSRTYEHLRLKYGSLRKGVITPLSVKEKISKANKGKTAWNKGIPRTAEEKQLMSLKRKETAKNVNVWNLGKAHSAETLKKIKEKANNRIPYICIHCNKSVTGVNFFRWHGENCREKTVNI